MVSVPPGFILFVQHGWADDHRAMLALAHQLVPNTTPIVAPDLGYIQTWIRIAPLIQQVETIAIQQMAVYPDAAIRIVGHSMGGLIWLEVLKRHPDWWPKVHSLALVASPVGGADLARIIDPLQLGIGIATDLGTNRKSIAEAIAEVIPTLVIAGDIDSGSDGTVTISCTKFANAHFVCLPGLSHPALRNHPAVATTIREFWLDTTIGESVCYAALHQDVIQHLRQTPGLTDAHWRGFNQAQIAIKFGDGSTLRTWRNWLGIEHVFLASMDGQCLYAGFVGWLHTQNLHQALAYIEQKYSVS